VFHSGRTKKMTSLIDQLKDCWKHRKTVRPIFGKYGIHQEDLKKLWGHYARIKQWHM